jgi:hypothetical protein
VRRGPAARGRPVARRRRLIEERSSSEGAHRKGADGGDARTESDAEEGLRWWEAGEADAWAVGDEHAALGCGRMRRTVWQGKNRSAGGGSLLRGSGGQQRGGVRQGGCHAVRGWRGAWLRPVGGVPITSRPRRVWVPASASAVARRRG